MDSIGSVEWNSMTVQFRSSVDSFLTSNHNEALGMFNSFKHISSPDMGSEAQTGTPVISASICDKKGSRPSPGFRLYS